MTSLDGLEVRLYGVAGTSILAPSNIHASVWLAETLPMLPRYGLPIDGTTTPYRPSPTHPPVKYHSTDLASVTPHLHERIAICDDKIFGGMMGQSGVDHALQRLHLAVRYNG
jgi:hypothetical protein